LDWLGSAQASFRVSSLLSEEKWMALIFVLLGVATQFLSFEFLMPRDISSPTDAVILMGFSALYAGLVTVAARAIGGMGNPVLQEPLGVGLSHLTFCWQCGALFALYAALLKAFGPTFSLLQLNESWTLALVAIGAVIWWGVVCNFLLAVAFGKRGVRDHWSFVERYYSTFRK